MLLVSDCDTGTACSLSPAGLGRGLPSYAAFFAVSPYIDSLHHRALKFKDYRSRHLARLSSGEVASDVGRVAPELEAKNVGADVESNFAWQSRDVGAN